METHSVTRKRPKQACKNCRYVHEYSSRASLISYSRRKKARCPGERPACSFCNRLRQICEYDELPVHREQTRASSGQAKAVGLCCTCALDANTCAVKAGRPRGTAGVQAERPNEHNPRVSSINFGARMQLIATSTPAVSPTGQRRSFDSPLSADREDTAWSQSAHSEQKRQDSSASTTEYHRYQHNSVYL